jgi:hypothetical protein
MMPWLGWQAEWNALQLRAPRTPTLKRGVVVDALV